VLSEVEHLQAGRELDRRAPQPTKRDDLDQPNLARSGRVRSRSSATPTYSHNGNGFFRQTMLASPSRFGLARNCLASRASSLPRSILIPFPTLPPNGAASI
jgi:hypothetical protein